MLFVIINSIRLECMRYLMLLLTGLATTCFSEAKASCSLQMNASKVVCVDNMGVLSNPEITVQIENGKAPYTFKWESDPYIIGKQTLYTSYFLEDTTVQNPVIKNPTPGTDSLLLRLTVTDADGNTCTDSMLVYFSMFGILTVDTYWNIQPGDTVTIFPATGGGFGPYTYTWYPNYNISDTTTGSPLIWPEVDTLYHVRVVDAKGCVSSFNIIWNIYVRPTSVINRLSASEDLFSVYPNPVTDQTLIQVKENVSDVKIRMLDIQGKMIWQSESGEKMMEIGRILKSPGTYLVWLKDADGRHSFKKVIRN